MSIKMPEPDQAVLARRGEIVAALRWIVPGEGVIDSAAEMIPYESDGLMAYRQPDRCRRARQPFTGAGHLAGGHRTARRAA